MHLRGDVTCGIFRKVPLASDSFPSGHAIIADAIVVFPLLSLNRAWRITVVCLNGSVLMARVYLRAQDSLEVVGGAAVGVVVGCLLNLGDRRLARRRPDFYLAIGGDTTWPPAGCPTSPDIPARLNSEREQARGRVRPDLGPVTSG